MVQYYTLEEAAKILGTSTDELKLLARKGDLRAFQDRGNFRFRSQEIDELARQRGLVNSDPDLQFKSGAKAGDSPPPKKAGEESTAEQPVFDFNLGTDDSDEEVPLGAEPSGDSPSGKKKGSSSKQGRTPRPAKSGSDSDVRLVADGSDLDFRVASDSEVKMVDEPATSKSGARKAKADGGSDSDVKIVPAGSDDDISLGQKPVKSASDSDIRLEPDAAASGGKKKGMHLTDEIDLDAELQKQEAQSKGKKTMTGGKDAPKTSPFELSEMDMKVPGKGRTAAPSSDDFELTPASEQDQSPIDLGSDEEILLKGESKSGKSKPPASKPKAKKEEDSSGDFELPAAGSGKSDSDSEFELSLDEGDAAPASGESSDSEFELTLDDDGGLVPTEDKGEKAGEEKDIFETDFEVPALDEESGSEAMALEESDTDLESSDFDIALGEDDAASDEVSGSQVVALEDEEADDVEATVQRTRRPAAAAAGDDEVVEDFDDLDLEGERAVVEEGEGEERVIVEKAAPWGALPAIVLIPTVIILLLGTFMSWEMMHIMWANHQGQKASGIIAPWLAYDVFGIQKPKE